MKKLITLLAFLSIIACTISCDEEIEEPNDFNGNDYRIGLWITPDKTDTLEFIDNTNVIRRGDYYVYQEYVYRIEGENLFLRLSFSTYESQHPIMSVNESCVTLGNMYVSNGTADNSGTFYKETNN